MNDKKEPGFTARCLLAALLLCANAAVPALTITPTYLAAAGESWSSDRITTVDAAIDLWESKVTSLGTVGVTVTFESISGSALAEWRGAIAAPSGADLLPDSSYVTHSIVFNTAKIGDMFFDTTPSGAADLPFGDYDAFSVALHEIGHMLGFTDGFYVQNFATSSAFDPWGSWITGDVFDSGGLSVAMNGDHAHIASSGIGGYLMEPAIFNGERRTVSNLELQMLAKAYDYSVVPLPATLPLLLSGLGALGMLRRFGKRHPWHAEGLIHSELPWLTPR